MRPREMRVDWEDLWIERVLYRAMSRVPSSSHNEYVFTLTPPLIHHAEAEGAWLDILGDCLTELST
jgi:hypothetical protein